MALNREFVGREVALPEAYEVSRVKIAEFATAVGETSPLCRDADAARAAGYGDVVAPPTFGIVVSMLISAQVVRDPGLGLDYSRVVHGEQRFVAHRPIQAGDVLSGSGTVEGVRTAGSNELLTVRCSLRDRAGDPVFDAYSTIVSRGTAGAGEA